MDFIYCKAKNTASQHKHLKDARYPRRSSSFVILTRWSNSFSTLPPPFYKYVDQLSQLMSVYQQNREGCLLYLRSDIIILK